MSQSTNEKPVYSLNASLINSLKWHEYRKDEQSYEDLVKKIQKDYEGNFFTKRGETFEDDVFAGNHSVFNKHLKNTTKQKWYNKTIDYGDFIIRYSGRVDAVSNDGKHIYDIKRVNYHYKGKYDSDKTVQHNLYMFLNDDAEDFTYLIAANGSRKNELEYHIEVYGRPDNLDELIKEETLTFLNFLFDKGLVEEYMKSFEFKRRY